ncbi:MAG TPA: hypothetical protein PL037_00135 [Elusimicrobiales bacterium]|nr:hypothetical protein [Elusimicrobiales bacterium]
MELMRVIAVLIAFSAAAAAQGTKDHPSVPAKKVEAVSPGKSQPEAEENSTRRSGRGAAETGREEEEGQVLIDGASEEDSPRTPDTEEEKYEPEKKPAGGIPSSYGQLKGTLSEGEKSFLVFEGDDGTIYLVQITPGKSGASWKLASKIPRSAD